LAETVAETIEKPEPDGVEPPKRGRGRPPIPREGIPDAQPLPGREPGTEEDQFFNWIQQFTETDWQDTLFMYLYRCEPYTDRKQTGNKNYLTKFTKPVDQQEIMEEYGSGKYLLVLNRFDAKIRKYKIVENHYFRILNHKFPPKIPLGEWVDDDRNSDWAWCKPQLEADSAKLKSKTGAGVPDIDMFNAVMDRVEKLNPGKGRDELGAMAQLVVQTVQGQLKASGDSQTNTMAVVDRIITALKPAGDGGSDLVKILMAQNEASERRATEERAANRDLMTKLLDRPAPPAPPSLTEQLSVLGGLKETLRGLFGRGDGGGSKTTEVLDVVREVVPEVVKVVDHIAQGYMMSKGIKPDRRQPTVNVNPQLPAANASQPTAGTKEQTPEEQQIAMMTEINGRFGWVIDQVAPELSNIFVDGEPGMAFREFILERFGSFVYNQVQKFSVETIMTLIEIRKTQGDPTVQVRLQALQPPEKVAQFIQEFLSDEPYDTEDDETPDEAATGASSDF